MTLLIALVLAASPTPPTSARQVTVPLDEFERLRKLEERPSLTVVELLRLEGSFARRDLALTLAGRAAGTWPTQDVLNAEGVRVHSCQGEALVSHNESGGFSVTPLASRFQVRCRLALDGNDRIAGSATRAVLEVASAVQDGELVASAAGQGGRSFSVVRVIAGGKEDIPPSVAGRYRVTLLPDEARFVYQLDVRNPARGHRKFEVTLRESEHVESVEAPVTWDAEGRRYRFDLPPGETTLSITGRLTAARFAPTVGASLQYLLLESHPLIRPDVRTSAKRVGVGETGLPPAYRGAQAFLLESGGEVAWTATRLEALKTAGLALNQLTQVFFLGADGKARGEASFTIDNQGAPALALPAAGEPTFASVQGDPAFLTRDAEGRLFLPLGQGAQNVLVQDVRPFRRVLGLGWARLELPRAGVPASRADVQIRYPAEWIPLYEELAPATRFHFPGSVTLLALGVLLVLSHWLLALGGLPARRRWIVTGAVTLLAAFSDVVLSVALVLVTAPLLALATASLVRRFSGVGRVLALLGAALAVLVVLAFFAALNVVHPLGRSEMASAPVDYARLSKAAGERGDATAPATSALAGGGASYEGLPAKIEIPPGARRTSFSRELLATDVSRPVFVMLVSARLVAALTAALAFLVVLVLFALRRELVVAGRAFVRRLRAPPDVSAGLSAGSGS